MATKTETCAGRSIVQNPTSVGVGRLGLSPQWALCSTIGFEFLGLGLMGLGDLGFSDGIYTYMLAQNDAHYQRMATVVLHTKHRCIHWAILWGDWFVPGLREEKGGVVIELQLYI